jgi:hypothetical protein
LNPLHGLQFPSTMTKSKARAFAPTSDRNSTDDGRYINPVSNQLTPWHQVSFSDEEGVAVPDLPCIPLPVSIENDYIRQVRMGLLQPYK